MFAKLLAVILSVGVIASALLVMRQQRINTFHEISAIHEKIMEHERVLWKLRNQIANRVRPAEVRVAMDMSSESWEPIPARPDLVIPGLPEDPSRMAQQTMPQPAPVAPASDSLFATSQGDRE